jgi:hypothetical protein
MKNCVGCGVSFDFIYKNKKFCSVVCYRKTSKKYKTPKREAYDFIYMDKVDKGCSKCPERRPSCLQYHHIDPLLKTGCVSNMVSYGLRRLVSEMNKCVLLCANCHAVETNGDGYRPDFKSCIQYDKYFNKTLPEPLDDFLTNLGLQDNQTKELAQ